MISKGTYKNCRIIKRKFKVRPYIEKSELEPNKSNIDSLGFG